MRVLVTMLALSVLILDAPAAWAEVPVELAGTTVISGDDAGSVLVRVPKDLTLPLGNMESVFSVDAPDEVIAAFALVNTVPVDSAAGFHGYLVGVRSAVAFGDERDESWHEESGVDDDGVLAAGVYRLYLFTEAGIPATVTLHLPGLAGAVAVAPTRPATYHTTRFEQNRTVLADGQLYTNAWEEHSVEGPSGFGFMAYTLARTAPDANRVSMCWYEGGVVTPEAYATNLCASVVSNDGTFGHGPAGGVWTAQQGEGLSSAKFMGGLRSGRATGYALTATIVGDTSLSGEGMWASFD